MQAPGSDGFLQLSANSLLIWGLCNDRQVAKSASLTDALTFLSLTA
jgi:hypothetical protein